MIFSWLSWLAVLLVGAYARRRRRRRRRRSRATWRPYSKRGWHWETKPWFNLYFIDIGYQRYDQLTPVKTGYPLTSTTWPYRGLKFTAHRGHMFFWSWPLTNCYFSNWIAGSCQVNLFKTGQGCSEEPNYNFFIYKNDLDSGLKINWIINFLLKIVFCCFLLCIWWLSKLITEAQTIDRKRQRKFTKLKSKFYLFLG